MKRKGSAVWKGSLKEGKGTVSLESGILKDTNYSYKTRFEDDKVAVKHGAIPADADVVCVGKQTTHIGRLAVLVQQRARLHPLRHQKVFGQLGQPDGHFM